MEHINFTKVSSKSYWFHGWESELNYGGLVDIVNDEFDHWKEFFWKFSKNFCLILMGAYHKQI